MPRFDSAIALALRLIDKNGETSTFRRKVDGAPPDPAKPWEPGAPTYTDVSVRAVWLNFDFKRIDGELVKTGDQDVYVAAAGLALDPDPATDVLIRASGERWTIVSSNLLAPNGQRVLLQMHVRK